MSENAIIVEGEIVEDKKEALKQYLFHPSTVLTMMALDWGGLLLEIPETFAPILLLITSLLIFIISFGLSYYFQRKFAGDSKNDAIIKSVLAGIICAIPYPIMTTGVGAVILTLSGVNAVGEKGIVGLIEMFKKRV
jgi:hypothetical protein